MLIKQVTKLTVAGNFLNEIKMLKFTLVIFMSSDYSERQFFNFSNAIIY